MSKTGYLSSWDLAVLYVGLGDKDRAIEQLNKAYEDRAGWIIALKSDVLAFRSALRRTRAPHEISEVSGSLT